MMEQMQTIHETVDSKYEKHQRELMILIGELMKELMNYRNPLMLLESLMKLYCVEQITPPLKDRMANHLLTSN